jgi:hypothetical protein
MSGYTWKLLDWFRENKGKSQTRLAINSNLGTQVDIDRLFSSVDAPIDLYTSNESIGPHAEYIRDGLVWDDWINNIELICKKHRDKVRGLHVMCTINALCLESLPNFLTKLLEFKSNWGEDYPSFTLNILRFPSFQSPLVLPDNIRTHYKTQLENWLNTWNHHAMLHDHERSHVQRLIDYLDVVRTPHSDAAEQLMLQQDFKKFYTQYDTRRNKDFSTTFPHLTDWFNKI